MDGIADPISDRRRDVRTIQRLTRGQVYATRVQFDGDWGEYLVTAYYTPTATIAAALLTRHSSGTYHSDNKADALQTAKAIRGIERPS